MKFIIIPNEPNPNMTGRHYGIAKALIAAGHEVHTVMWDLPQQMSRLQLIKHLFTSLRTRKYRYEELYMHHFGRLPLFWPHINGILFSRQLKKLFYSSGADIIITQSYTNETIVPSSLPYIYDLADDYYAPAEVFGSVAYKLMFKLLGVRSTMRHQAQNSLAVTAVSDVLCDYAQKYNKRVLKLPNGVETALISHLQAPAKVPPHSLVYVSGFGAWSQPLKTLQAVVDLKAEFPDLTLTLVGEGSEVSAMQQFITRHEAELYIDYRGFVHDRSQVFNIINQHSIGLATSEKNTWRDAAHPMKVIEYTALGKKVVSSDLAGVTALQQPNIYSFSNDDPDGLETALRQALASPHTDYQKLADQTLHKYNWQHIVGQLIELTTAVKKQRRLPAIIHVTPSYPPVLGGLEKVVQVLAQTQAEAGYTVSVLTSKSSISNTDRDVVPVKRFRNFVVANTIVMPGLFWQLLKVSRHDFVHLHITQALTPEMVWIASRIKGFGYIAHIHLDIPASGLSGFLLNIYKPLFLKRVLQRARSVVVFTADQQENMSRLYRLPFNRVRVISNGVEDIFFYNKKRSLHPTPRLLFVGRLGYQKNVSQLLEALQGVSNRFETIIVGNGELEAELKIQATTLRLNNLTFVGRTEGVQLRNYYKSSDIFVLPSEREGMPLVLLEAMAMGLPVVATDVTGNRDVIQHNKNGLLVPFGDSAALRRALLLLISKPKLYGKLQQTARSMSSEYSWRKLVTEFDPLYREIT